jgi:hypothetical protein
MRQYRVLEFSRHLGALPLYMAGVLAVSGCGDGRLPLNTVTGKATVDGKPAHGMMLVFCPVETSSAELSRERPIGFAGPDGSFTLTTFSKGDGVPVGEYKVLAQWLTPSAGPDGATGQPRGPDRLRGRYMNLDSTPLSATITAETVEIPPFEFSSR